MNHVQSPKPNNVPLFITVLSACLGLLTLGAADQALARSDAYPAEPAASTREVVERREELSNEVRSLLKSRKLLLSLREFVSDVKNASIFGSQLSPLRVQTFLDTHDSFFVHVGDNSPKDVGLLNTQGTRAALDTIEQLPLTRLVVVTHLPRAGIEKLLLEWSLAGRAT